MDSFLFSYSYLHLSQNLDKIYDSCFNLEKS